MREKKRVLEKDNCETNDYINSPDSRCKLIRTNSILKPPTTKLIESLDFQIANMNFVSALIFACVFACASAQFGVKGGSSVGSVGVRGSPFVSRPFPGSIQEKKDQLANVDEVGGPSTVGGSTGSNGAGFVQPAGQPENVVTFVQERPTQSILVPASGSVSSLPAVGQVSTSVGPQSQLVQTVQPVQSSFAFQPVLPAPAVGQVQVAQVAQPAIQSFPSAKAFQPNGFFFDNRQPAQFQFGAAPVNPSFPNFAQNIVHFAPQPQFSAVPAFASNGFASSAFGPNAFAPATFGPAVVGKVGKQFVAPNVVPQPAPVQSFPAFQSFPAGFAPVQPVTTLSNGFTVPSVSTSGLPVPAFPNQVAPTFVNKLSTDNKISSGFGSVQQVQPSVISQEKQSAETVQTTEW
ncbi:uncharacterized protein LOC128391455 [Panonychus citri]|uniref:uncharacterized protein LOC128391455 n=1 Tax=Panonychus citri TaxID=50023 RepID=UPI00230708D5|nr:uncharacterized protein LOC128391455 [Panonychus citri]